MDDRDETIDQLVATVGRFAREVLIPAEQEVEEVDDIPQPIIRQIKELGLFGMTIAETYGGLGLSLYEEARVVSALTYASPVYRSYFGTSNGVGTLGITVDGTDFFAVHEAAGEIIRRARQGGGPALLECKMVRFFGHFEGDAQTYRGRGELERIRNEQDCLRKFSAAVTGAGVIKANELQAIDHEVLGLIERAVIEAKAAPLPTAADLTTDVYVRY